MKKKIIFLLQSSGFQSTVKITLSGLLSILIGQALSKIFEKEWVFFLAFGIVFIVFIVVTLIFEHVAVNFNISKIIEKDLKDKKYKSVIRLAYPLSRPLWIAGKYDLRIKLGRQVLTALNSLTEDTLLLDDKKVSVEELKARILIDDLGWTIFRTNMYSEECIANIEEGIIIAEEEQLYPIAVKGHRHLIGIYDKLGNKVKIDENISKARDLCNSDIYKKKVSAKERESVIKGLDYALLKIQIERYKEENSSDTAILDSFISQINSLSNYYKTEEDWERYAKTFYVKSDILMLYNQRAKDVEAVNILQEGLNVCDEQARNDGYIRIAINLMILKNKQILSIKNDKDEKARLIKEFKEYYRDAMKRAKEINNKEHIHKLKELLTNVGKRKI